MIGIMRHDCRIAHQQSCGRMQTQHHYRKATNPAALLVGGTSQRISRSDTEKWPGETRCRYYDAVPPGAVFEGYVRLSAASADCSAEPESAHGRIGFDGICSRAMRCLRLF